MLILYYPYDLQSKHLSDLYILSLYFFIHRHIISLALCSQHYMVLFRGPALNSFYQNPDQYNHQGLKTYCPFSKLTYSFILTFLNRSSSGKSEVRKIIKITLCSE
jgi:hypothetical protein